MIEAAIVTNYIHHMNAFFGLVRKDGRLHANHISLYIALFQVWNQHRFQNPFPILREEVISLCRIGSLNTYTKALKELQSLGYIEYYPSPNLRTRSTVAILRLDSIKNDTRPQVKIAPATRCKNDTVVVADLRLFNKQINNKTKERGKTLPPIKKNIHSPNQEKNETPNTFQPPGIREVQEFFGQSGYPPDEASKFFYHYQANGWLQGGKTKIINWEAAAHKWVLSINPQKEKRHEQRRSGPGRLNVNPNKSYSDPL